jgi:hypothetical protein
MLPLRVPSSLTATRALCGPHVSPSTSTLCLVLSHGDWEESKSATCWASWMPPRWWGRGWGIDNARPAALGFWDPLAPELKPPPGKSLSDWQEPCSPPVLTVVIHPVLNMFKQIDCVLCGLMGVLVGKLCGRKDTEAP